MTRLEVVKKQLSDIDIRESVKKYHRGDKNRGQGRCSWICNLTCQHNAIAFMSHVSFLGLNR